MGLEWMIVILILIAIAVSLLGSISGVGGGVLYVPILLLLLTDKSFAQIKFVSTLLVFTSSAINLLIEIIKKRVNWWLMLSILLTSVPSIFFGNWLSDQFNPKISKIIIIILLIGVTFLLLLMEYGFKHKNKIRNYDPKKWYILKLHNGTLINLFWIVLISITGGIVTSLTGMGGGPILMPMLLLIVGLKMKDASVISHTIIAISSAISLIFSYKMFADQNLNLTISLPMIFGVIGGTIVAIFVKQYFKNEIVIKWILILLIWISIAKMIYDLV